MNNIHHIVYINLEHRADRRAEVEGELTSRGLSGERFDAINERPGIVGCGKSHLAVLERAQEQGWEHVLILEDDFQFDVDKETADAQMQAFFDLKIPYDVLMLSYGMDPPCRSLDPPRRSGLEDPPCRSGLEDLLEPYNEVVSRAVNATTASGYLVHSRFYDALIANLKEAIPQLICTGRHWDFANDIYWWRLQSVSQWFCMNTRIGRQRPSYSDISDRFVHYTNC